jgi:hypothetical protein
MEGKLRIRAFFRVVARLNRSCARTKSALISGFQRFDIDLLHLKHRLHNAFGFFLIAVVQHVDQNGGSDLPRQTEFVLEPAAGRFLATVCGEFIPEIIHFLLRLAVYDEGDGFIEFEKRSTVKSDELLAFDFEFDRQHRSDRMPGFFRCFFSAPENSADLRIFEERRVEVRGLLGLTIKPQEWSNFLHQKLCRFDSHPRPAEFGVLSKPHTMLRC